MLGSEDKKYRKKECISFKPKKKKKKIARLSNQLTIYIPLKKI